MNGDPPGGFRRRLALELVNWARFEATNKRERVGRWGHASCVGWMIATAELTTEEREAIDRALEPDK